MIEPKARKGPNGIGSPNLMVLVARPIITNNPPIVNAKYIDSTRPLIPNQAPSNPTNLMSPMPRAGFLSRYEEIALKI